MGPWMVETTGPSRCGDPDHRRDDGMPEKGDRKDRAHTDQVEDAEDDGPSLEHDPRHHRDQEPPPDQFNTPSGDPERHLPWRCTATPAGALGECQGEPGDQDEEGRGGVRKPPPEPGEHLNLQHPQVACGKEQVVDEHHQERDPRARSTRKTAKRRALEYGSDFRKETRTPSTCEHRVDGVPLIQYPSASKQFNMEEMDTPENDEHVIVEGRQNAL